MDEPALTVQLAWVAGDRVQRRDLVLPGVASGITLGQLRRLPAFLQALPPMADACGLAIFGQRRRDDEPVFDHDRLEFLPPLRVDPKVARQRRADHRRRTQAHDRWAPDRR
jgi:putative ubiquitin-RnfH superfamily antitoxin RatB of RatAB toxin-antitoxin module